MDILQQFKTNLVSFFDELIDMFPDESQFVMFRILIKDQLPIVLVMDQFIKNVMPLRDTIKKRDDRIFTESDALYFGMDKTETDVFRRIWISPSLDREDRAAIWKWLDAFVIIADKYIKASSQ
jgi:hypothetical protein